MLCYPMKLLPYVSETVWGGRRLIDEYGVDPGAKANCAEAWVLSAHPKGSSVVRNGAYAGQSLHDLAATFPELFGCCGTAEEPPRRGCGTAGEPPRRGCLIKLIDARADLSVQVHPHDGDAVLRPGEAGKTECWYILDADPGAHLLLGFREPTFKEAFACAIRENRLTELTQFFPVKAGDFFFIPAGTLHAIGGGILLAEVQQSSDTTYRVYDYNRKPPRELHIEQALAVTHVVPYTQKQTPALIESGRKSLVRCEYFAVEEWSPADAPEGRLTACAPPESYVSLLALEGAGQVVSCGESLPFAKGESVLLPAGSGAFTMEGAVKALVTTPAHLR